MKTPEIYQFVFDYVVVFLFAQKKRSMLGGRCAYGGEEGRRCAAGCLMPPDINFALLDQGNAAVIHHSTDYSTAVGLRKDIADAIMRGLAMPLEQVPWELIRRLQGAHDSGEMIWRDSFHRIAHDFGLSVEAMRQAA